ncbi:NIPSNAP family protein [Polaromonas sp. P1(28)-13]|nr:NIPSNAP family protein [Polaromonas sp. P1(28)-13]
MVIEERTYTIQPERMKEYLALYEGEGLPIQSKVLRMLGYFQTEGDPLKQVVHLWAYDSMEDRSRRRAELQTAPGWKAYVAKVKPFYVKQECRIMAPLPWSPIR